MADHTICSSAISLLAIALVFSVRRIVALKRKYALRNAEAANYARLAKERHTEIIQLRALLPKCRLVERGGR